MTRGIRSRDNRPTSYYVYLLLCDDGSHYTGYTSNVTSRLQRHKTGQGARYTKMRRPKRIVYLERFGTRSAAMRREREIKGLTHSQKRDLAGRTLKVDPKRMRQGYRRKMPLLER